MRDDSGRLEVDDLFQTMLSALWASAPDAIVLCDVAGQIVLANSRVHELLGWDPEDLAGMSVDKLVPHADRANHAAHRQAYLEMPYSRAMGEKSILKALTPDERAVPVDISLSSFVFEGERFVLVIMRDARARFRYEEELRLMSFHDGLTGLYNRAFLDEELERMERGRLRPITVLVADLDGMKSTNDQHGHAAGDQLLVRSAAFLKDALRAEDIIARTGGDEFVALLPQVGEDIAQQIEQRLREASLREKPEPIMISIGTAVAEPGELLRDTMRRADAAMYKAKRAKKSSHE